MTAPASIPPRSSIPAPSWARASRSGPFAHHRARRERRRPLPHRAARHAASGNVRLAAGVQHRRGLASLGGEPQDFKFTARRPGSRSATDTVIREYCTINRGTAATGRTIDRRQLLPHDLRARGARLPRRRPRHHRQRHPDRRARHHPRPRHPQRPQRACTSSSPSASYAFVGGCSPGQPGRAAVREGGRQPDGALRAQHDRPAARRRSAPRRSPASSAPTASFFNSDLNLGQAHRARPAGTAAAARNRALPRLRRVLGRGASPRERPRSRSASSASGRWAGTTPATSPRRPRPRLVGVYDADRARAREVAAACRLPRLRRARRAAGPGARRSPSPCRRPSTPRSGSRRCERGVPVLMEKPLAATLAEADALVAAAARQGVQLQVGHIERFNRPSAPPSRCCDHPRYLESQRLAPFQPRGTDVAVVLDLMIHDLDLLLHLTGGAEATDVRASGVAVLSPHLDMANARVEFARAAWSPTSPPRAWRASGCAGSGSSRPTATSRSTSPPGSGTSCACATDGVPASAQELGRHRGVHSARGARGRRALARAAQLRPRRARRARGGDHRRGGPGGAGAGAARHRCRDHAPLPLLGGA